MKLKLEFISSSKLNEKSPKSRIDFILGRVKDGRILIMDGVLKAEEEMMAHQPQQRIEDTVDRCGFKFGMKR